MVMGLATQVRMPAAQALADRTSPA
jgi:hypothetical protein